MGRSTLASFLFFVLACLPGCWVVVAGWWLLVGIKETRRGRRHGSKDRKCSHSVRCGCPAAKGPHRAPPRGNMRPPSYERLHEDEVESQRVIELSVDVHDSELQAPEGVLVSPSAGDEAEVSIGDSEGEDDYGISEYGDDIACSLPESRAIVAQSLLLLLCWTKFLLSLQDILEADHASDIGWKRWGSVFTPVWLATGGYVLKSLYSISADFLETTDSCQECENLLHYHVVVSICLFVEEVLIWLHVSGLFTILPWVCLMLPLWIVALFGSLLLFFAAPPSHFGPEVEENFEVEMQLAARINVWMYGVQMLLIALKLDGTLSTSWEKVLLPTALLLLVLAVVVIPYGTGLFVGAAYLLCSGQWTSGMALDFWAAALPLTIAVTFLACAASFLGPVRFSLVHLVTVTFRCAKVTQQPIASLTFQVTALLDGASPELQLSPLIIGGAVASVLVPINSICCGKRQSLLLSALEDAATPDSDDENEERPMASVPSFRLEAISSPVVLLRQSSTFFREASLSVRGKFQDSPLMSRQGSFSFSSAPWQQVDADDDADDDLVGGGGTAVEEASHPHCVEKISANPHDCLICLSAPSDAVMMECGHSGVCFDCVQSILHAQKEHRHCPMCRAEISRVVKLPEGGGAGYSFQGHHVVRSKHGLSVEMIEVSDVASEASEASEAGDSSTAGAPGFRFSVF
ncbi:unnamed protein product [Chrysoparadoxa australica]